MTHHPLKNTTRPKNAAQDSKNSGESYFSLQKQTNNNNNSNKKRKEINNNNNKNREVVQYLSFLTPQKIF